MKKEGISGEILEKILDAARVAPSGKNRQPWKFLVYGGEEKKEILKKMRAGIKRELKEPLFKDSKRLLPDADRKIKKAIKKATTMDKYLTAVNMFWWIFGLLGV